MAFIRIILLVSLYLAAALAAPTAVWNNKIFGGQAAYSGQFQYMVSLRIDGSHACGGAIIHSQYILSAAHCFYIYNTPNMWTIHAGALYSLENGTIYEADRIIMHEYYNYHYKKNDIALLHVKSPILGSSNVDLINFDYNFLEAGNEVIITGWGRTSFEQIAYQLQWARLRTIDMGTCSSMLQGIDETQICTLTFAGQGTCHGDSGGPLVHNNLVVGIVSWGIPCAGGYPDVFTRVSAYAAWIESHIQN